MVRFLFTFWPVSKKIADVQKNVDGIEWLPIDTLHIGYHSFSVPSTVRQPYAKRCFVNKFLSPAQVGPVRLFEMKLPSWNWSFHALTHHFYIWTMSGKSKLRLIVPPARGEIVLKRCIITYPLMKKYISKPFLQNHQIKLIFKRLKIEIWKCHMSALHWLEVPH